MTDQSENSKWQSISTAPRDGTVIDLTAIDDNGEIFEIWPMQWGHIKTNEIFAKDVVGMWMTPNGSFTWNGTPEEGGPTHWRPYQKKERR